MRNITVDARMINSSGIGRVIRNILKRIILSKAEFNFSVLGDINELKKYSYLQMDNVTLVNCSVPIYSISEQFALIKSIPKNTDIFWAPHYNIPLFYRGKLVVTIHDVIHLAMSKFFLGFSKQMYAEFMYSMVKKKASKIVTVSRFSASEINRYLDIPIDKIKVIHIGIDQEWFNVNIENRLRRNPYILYVGNVKPHKNLSTLVKAFKLIRNNCNYDLVIVGKKEGFITEDKELANLVEENNSRIYFTGFVDDKLLKQYYKQAAVFVFPSLYEGFGLPPLEALAAGCPRVICSNSASIPEVCGDMVEYFEPYDIKELSMKLLSNNNVTIKTDKLYEYNWDKTSEEMLNIFRRI